MKHSLLLALMTSMSVTLFSQEKIQSNPATKIEAFNSKTGVIIKFTDYKLPAIKASYGDLAACRVRVITSGGSQAGYFFQVEKQGKYGSSTASIEYLDLLEVIKALVVLKAEVEKDQASSPEYLENKFTTVDGFQVGYFINDGKVKWYLQLEKYGSDKTIFIDKVETIETAFEAAKVKMEELRK